MIYQEVKDVLLKEAQSSPYLLSDLAGLECYISESYHNRSFIELLQNADDAGATKFSIFREDDYLYVANNGRIFSKDDFESLCRSASSKKIKGSTIGYRGIGFKSVVGFSKEILVFSGEVEIMFSTERTKELIPSALKVPLIRIPHEITYDKTFVEENIKRLKNDGYSTIFVFKGLNLSSIEMEFDCFENNSLLFLKNIRETYFKFKTAQLTSINKSLINNGLYSVSLKTIDGYSSWLISNCNNTSLAFSMSNGKVVKMQQDKSFVHAFLPTEDTNGLGVLINGNFSTDPSRRHIIFDDETSETILNCCKHIINLIETSLKNYNENSIGIITSLIPVVDIQLVQFTKNSFVKSMLNNIRNLNNNFISSIKLCPKWLNARDYTCLTKGHLNVIDDRFYNIPGFYKYMKYLGSKEPQLHELVAYINISDITANGCVQFVKQLFSAVNNFDNISNDTLSDLRIFYSNGKRVSINDLKQKCLSIDESFMSLLAENGFVESDVKFVFKKFSMNNNENQQPSPYFHEETKKFDGEKSNYNTDMNNHGPQDVMYTQKNTVTQKVVVKQWRCAEELTLEILNQKGFSLKDVSKQNVGYDLEGFDPNGKEVQIEVKSVSYVGQRFRFTNNEIAVAQDKRKTYYVAIVRQCDNIFEIALIQDPINNLTLNRQCVQWVWECENYDYKPIRFEM